VSRQPDVVPGISRTCGSGNRQVPEGKALEGVGEGLRYPIALWLPASADCRDELQVVESLVSPGWFLLRDDLQYF
jgi:hypothetical protein